MIKSFLFPTNERFGNQIGVQKQESGENSDEETAWR